MSGKQHFQPQAIERRRIMAAIIVITIVFVAVVSSCGDPNVVDLKSEISQSVTLANATAVVINTQSYDLTNSKVITMGNLSVSSSAKAGVSFSLSAVPFDENYFSGWTQTDGTLVTFTKASSATTTAVINSYTPSVTIQANFLVRPTIQHESPLSTETNASSTVEIAATFDQVMDATTASDASNIYITTAPRGDNSAVATAISDFSVAFDSKKITITPNSSWGASKIINIKLLSKIKSAAGAPLGADVSWTFLTGVN